MNLSSEDKQLLQDLCNQHEIQYDKVVKLLEAEREYEFKHHRSGIYEALRGIMKRSRDV